MANLTSIEKRQFEDLFCMSNGYVLDYSDNSFRELFRSVVNVNIDAQQYLYNGTSKAKKLRAFWEQEPEKIVGKILRELLDVWKYKNQDQKEDNLYKKCRIIVNKLDGHEELEESFLVKDFGKMSFDKLPIECGMIPIVQSRYEEACLCLKHNAPLSVIFLCGSILEGILLGIALQNSNIFVQSVSALKSKNKVVNIKDWKLGNLIDVAYNINLLGQDVAKFSHVMRDFRNYIHPYEQMSSQFNPDIHTAKICMQVLSAAIANLSGSKYTLCFSNSILKLIMTFTANNPYLFCVV